MDKPKYPRFLGRTDTALEQERDGWSAAIVYLNEERARLLAENERLRAALRPFALEGEDAYYRLSLPEDHCWGSLTYGDFVRAADALAALGQPPPEDG